MGRARARRFAARPFGPAAAVRARAGLRVAVGADGGALFDVAGLAVRQPETLAAAVVGEVSEIADAADRRLSLARPSARLAFTATLARDSFERAASAARIERVARAADVADGGAVGLAGPDAASARAARLTVDATQDGAVGAPGAGRDLGLAPIRGVTVAVAEASEAGVDAADTFDA